MGGDRQCHAGKQHPKLQIMVLHGSRQDGEVFSQRLKTLIKKLKNIADLHFVSAPHKLPLQDGQRVHMRAWWRHWNIGTEEAAAALQEAGQQQQGPTGSSQTSSTSSNGAPNAGGQQQQVQLAPAASAGPPASASPFGAPSVQPAEQQQDEEELPGQLVQQLQRQPSLLHGQARQEEISSMMASGWEAVVLRDWAVSLQHLTDVWTSAAQEFDGVLGFSNGAAAAFLFAAHAAAHPETFGSLRFVALAGGYVPEPLKKLLHSSLLAPGSSSSGGSSGSSGDVPPVTRLKAPLPFPSLHMMGSNDPLIDVDVATQLMECFQPHGRVQLVHDSGHCVPQQARFMQDILKFIVSFAEIPLAPARPHHPRKQHAPAAAAAAAAVPPSGVAVAEIESQLHRQGLREKVSKGPAKKHLLIHMDSTGQPHQHHDHLISPKSSSHRNPQQHQQAQQHQHAQQQQRQQQQQERRQQAQRNGSHQQQAAAQRTDIPGEATVAAGTAVASASQSFGPATDLQLEELEALEAIFSSEYSLVSTCPPICVIKLREPGSEDAGEAQPPSAHFSLRFKLPQDYPSSASAQPLVDIEGPLGAHDPARSALQQHLASTAAEQHEELGGEAGYIWQLVGAAKDWIDVNIPADVATRRAGQLAGDVAAAAAAGAAGVMTSNGVHAAAAAAAAGGLGGPSVASSGAKGLPWWEREEVDLQLVARATAEAAHWASWSVNQDDNPWGSEDDDTAAAATAAAATAAAATASSGSSSAEALASAGDGVRGRWDYVIGLVGKPSAGKSTFFNAVTDPVNDEDAAKEGAYPFTTITPNVGRGFIALPDPSPMLGLTPDQVQPAYGLTPGLDISRVAQAGFSNIGPLQQLVRGCGWQQQQGGGDGILWRRVPVVVKDVAGLVPGAYQGRGRGNAFLSDLCDADVLVHVVDASGTTDSKGVAMAAGGPAGVQGTQQQGPSDPHSDKAGDAGGEDPIEEVSWVRRELHCWVFDNVRAKWATVLKRPSRLPQLFSGYHAPTGLVTAVLKAVGVRLEDLAAETAARGNAGLQGGTKEADVPIGGSSLASWGEWELHRLVAHFLAARFPILLALNKADLPSARPHIQSVLAAYPHHAAVAVSAAAERKLHQLRRQGLILYEDAASAAQVDPTAADSSSHIAATAALQNIQQSVLGPYGTTGVLAALTCAVALKPPRWVFPIADRERCVALAAAPNRTGAGGNSGSSGSSRSKHGGAGASSLGWGVDAKARAAQGAEAGVLRDCVLMKPGSRVEDVFWVLKRPPYALLEGDFVRAECRVLQPVDASSTAAAGGQQQGVQQSKMLMVRKDELVSPVNAVLLLQTNRKVSWQHGNRHS